MTAEEWKGIAPVASLISSILSSSPYWHQGGGWGRVSVSFYPPVTGCSQACPHAWDTTKQRHLMLRNWCHVLRVGSPSTLWQCGTPPLVVNTCNATIQSCRNTTHSPARAHTHTHRYTRTCVVIPSVHGECFTEWQLINKQTLICFHESIYLDMR